MTAECLHPYGGQPAERQPVFSCNVPLSLAAGLLDSLVFLRARSCSMHVAVVTSFVARAQCSHSCTALWSLATSSLSKGWQKRQGASANDWYGSKHTHTHYTNPLSMLTLLQLSMHTGVCAGNPGTHCGLRVPHPFPRTGSGSKAPVQTATQARGADPPEETHSWQASAGGSWQ